MTALPWLVANLIDAATFSLLTNLVRKSEGFSVGAHRVGHLASVGCTVAAGRQQLEGFAALRKDEELAQLA